MNIERNGTEWKKFQGGRPKKTKYEISTIEAEKYPEYLTLKEVAAIFRVSPQTVRNCILDGRIEAMKVFGLYRIPKAQFVKKTGKGGKK